MICASKIFVYGIRIPDIPTDKTDDNTSAFRHSNRLMIGQVALHLLHAERPKVQVTGFRCFVETRKIAFDFGDQRR